MSIIKSITKMMRIHHAKRFIKDELNKKLLDIGCGDRSFIDSLKSMKAVGIDLLYGQDAEKGLKYEKGTFDYVTLLAVIEHFHDHKKVIKECHRVLKKDGLLIMTTPMKKAEKFIKVYNRKDLGHNRYFTRKDFETLEGFRLTHYSAFEFGLNQMIVLKRV